MNYNEMSKEELIQLLNDNENATGKYGLVWDREKEPEKIVIDCDKNIPILLEKMEMNIDTDDINHILIEGDNFHSLSILNYTHKEKIDMIYIDPPYNLGNKDFIYNDNYIDKEDGYKHSKWLNFMYRRLKLARNLLKEDGVIFISIDDTEQAQLKLLCDKVFGEVNFISNSFVLDNLKGKTNDNFITSVGSRLYVYAKNKKMIPETGFSPIENVFADKIEEKYKQEDAYGFYSDITFKKTGQSKFREDRPFMYYPILAKNNKLYTITDEEYEKIYDKESKTFDDDFVESLKNKYSNYEFILPLGSNGELLRWTSGFNTFKLKMNNDIYYNNGVKQKSRPEANEMLQIYASGTPKSLMYKPAYSIGTQDLKDILPDNNFDFPKPVQLIKDLIKLNPNKNITILDFFAGSGTTGQAVMELNEEDGGNRQFILCTNNENNICENITYPRLKTVITGKRKDNSKYSDGLHAGLRCFVCNFVENSNNRDQLYFDLTEKCIPMLYIKDKNFIEYKTTNEYKIYTNKDNTSFTCVYYSLFGEKEDEFVEELEKINGNKSIYKFSLGDDIDTSIFKNVNNYRVEAIPYRIVELYKRIVKMSRED